ncbi:peptidoglycan DD-metalloendopeptidase family protein [Leptolyngbya sp. AN02str]|uniref:M23 family metallopeptidase n=1 Tax=Leptolyngbya sp. AN02str TaxID=3423363 RepID=UPI003D317309
MTQKPSKARNSHSGSSQWSAVLLLTLFAGTSTLINGLSIALASPEGDAPAVPSAQDLLTPAVPPAPAYTPPKPEPAPAPVERAAEPAPQPVAEPAPQRAAEPQAEPVVRSQPAPQAPAAAQESTNETPTVAQPAPERSPTAPQVPQVTEVPVISPNGNRGDRALTDFSELYIDTTDYSVGATEGNQPTVLFSERSTGCEEAMQPGQGVPASICRAVQSRMAQQQNGDVPGAAGQATPQAIATRGAGGSGSAGVSNPLSLQSFYNRTLRPLAVSGNGNVTLLYPLSIPAAITSVFGWRVHPISGDRRFHTGTDLAAPTGTPIVAAKSGKVDVAGFMGGYGLTVVLNHSNGREQSLYAHMSEIFVRPGEEVNQGDVIGRVGSTGNSTGPHLHFEFRELTSEGWVALDAGLALQTALAQFVSGFRLAQLPAPQFSPNFDVEAKVLPTLAISQLQDFGKLAGGVLPEVAIAAPGTIAAPATAKETAQPATAPAIQQAPQASDLPQAPPVDDLPEVRVQASIAN